MKLLICPYCYDCWVVPYENSPDDAFECSQCFPLEDAGFKGIEIDDLKDLVSKLEEFDEQKDNQKTS